MATASSSKFENPDYIPTPPEVCQLQFDLSLYLSEHGIDIPLDVVMIKHAFRLAKDLVKCEKSYFGTVAYYQSLKKFIKSLETFKE